MKGRPDPVDAVYAELLRAEGRAEALLTLLRRFQEDPSLLVSLLRRPVPAALLELVAETPPWSRDARVLAVVVLNPRAPRALALRLVPALRWRDLADVAGSPRVDPGARVRAETLLREQLPDLRLGERITLARLATPAVLAPMLADPEPRVAEASLLNPRLREEDLVLAVRAAAAPRALLEAAASSPRWRDCYAVRLALVLQPRTPLALALGKISSLLLRDLERVARTPGLPPLVQAAALRVAREAPPVDRR
ncbi:MAG TPA: hypothetical protein VMT87_01370 [Vicinamibacteria bacterium]|nr:hypothetical protein [Vicinamibacteria bacterium]